MTDRFTLHHGDCIEVMRGMADNSVDAIVTDPPYELGFMGKSWDASGIAFNVEVWAECLRVLKPGGHLLAFSGSRTYHRMAVAIEDAGFEVRDQIMWLYGSGFPKSLDVSKAIDKQRDDRADVLRVTSEIARLRDVAGLKNKDLDDLFGFAGMAGHWTSTKSQPAVPTIEQWTTLRARLLPDSWLDAEVWRLNGRKGTPGEAWEQREVVGSKKSSLGGTVAAGERNQEFIDKHRGLEFTVTAPATPAAQQWQGWGTALKPAHEPIVLARKPLIGTVAANVLAYGTGALNIDGCRVGMGEEYDPTKVQRQQKSEGIVRFASEGLIGTEIPTYNPQGRWPANVIHDGSDEVVAGFPVTASGARPAKANKPTGEHYDGGWGPISDGPRIEYEGGSAARFFYCAKASKRDRNEGLEGFAEKVARRYGQQGQGPKAQQTPRNPVIERNHHPTVKPTDLMRYLIRLITPPGGIVLDPFMGSGSTGKAAMFEGVRFIGIEQDAEYLAIAQARIEWALAQPLEDVIFPRASELSEDEMAQLAFPIATAEGEASA